MSAITSPRNEALSQLYAKATIERDTFIKGKIGEVEQKSIGIWERVKNSNIVKKSGELFGIQTGQTYAPQVVHKVIDGGFDFFWKEKAATGVLERTLQFFTGTARLAAKTSAKVISVPYAVPVISAASGAVGSIAIPALITIVQIVYGKMKGQKAERPVLPSLAELMSPDAQSKAIFDTLGTIATDQEKKDLNELLTIIQLTTELSKTKNPIEIRKIINNYSFQREDKSEVFLNGKLITEDEQNVIKNGIGALTSGFREVEMRITKLVNLISENSTIINELTPDDLKNPIIQKDGKMPIGRMPAAFSAEEDLWKNSIIRCNDGVYCLSQEIPNHPKGSIVPSEELAKISNQLKEIQEASKNESMESFKGTMHKGLKDQISRSLLQAKPEVVETIINGMMIERKDNKTFYLDGKIVEDKELINEKVKLLIDTEQDEASRKEASEDLVGVFLEHMPSVDKILSWENEYIKCDDGLYLKIEDGEIIPEDEINKIINESIDRDFESVRKEFSDNEIDNEVEGFEEIENKPTDEKILDEEIEQEFINIEQSAPEQPPAPANEKEQADQT
jgi:hypothetical protein